MTHMQTLKPAFEATFLLDEEIGGFIDAMANRTGAVEAPTVGRRLRRSSRRRRG